MLRNLSILCMSETVNVAQTVWALNSMRMEALPGRIAAGLEVTVDKVALTVEPRHLPRPQTRMCKVLPVGMRVRTIAEVVKTFGSWSVIRKDSDLNAAGGSH